MNIRTMTAPGGRIKSTLCLAGLFIAGVAQGTDAPPQQLAFEHTTLIDGTGSPPETGMTVVVIGDRIAEVGEDGSVDVPATARRIDARGKFLMPGMMDLHLHLIGAGAYPTSSAQSDKPVDFEVGLRALQGFLYYGFTSIYDAGNHPGFILGLREQERAGQIVSPRIFATGQSLSYPGSSSVGYGGIGVRDWPGTIEDLKLQISRDPDLQKITYEMRGVGPNPLIKSLPKPLMKRMIDYLHERGIRTTVHISDERMAREAIEAGADTLAHTPHNGLISQGFAELVAERKIPIQTSLAVWDEIARMQDGVEFLKTPEYAATVSPAEIPVREKAREDYYLRQGWPSWYNTTLPYTKRNVKMIHDAGGILALASDRTFGPAALRELELVVSTGITPLDVIRIATYNAAVFLGKESELGSVEAGKLADLVLLNADPTADISHVKQIALVMKGGRIIDRSSLDLPINNR